MGSFSQGELRNEDFDSGNVLDGSCMLYLAVSWIQRRMLASIPLVEVSGNEKSQMARRL